MSSIKDNRKQSSQGPTYYTEATQAGNVSPQFMQDVADQFGVPEDGIFNPYDYISQKNYKLNRRGQASYQEDLARLTYLADLRQQQFQNEYNSPENQAKLMREAGLNPDLQGLQGSSASAAGPSPSGSPMDNIPNNLQQATNVIGIINNVASLVTSMLSGGIGISQAFTSQLSSDMSLMSQAMDLFSTYGKQGFDVHKLPLSRRVKGMLNSQFGSLGFQNIANSRSTYANDLIAALFQSNFNRYSKEFNKFYNAPDYDGNQTIDLADWSYVWEPLAKFAEESLSYDFKSKSYSSKNELDFQSTTSSDGSSLGTMRGMSEREKSNQASFSENLRGPLREVVDRLKKNNSPWSNFALIALYLVCQLGNIN